MAKRKQSEEEPDSDDDGNQINLVNVDFDFFDPNPDVDFLALKRLLLQLFQADAEHLFPHDLADLVLSQPHVGSTVKTDGKESDPYAILTVLNMHAHQNHASMRALIAYALAKVSANPSFHSALQSLIGPGALSSPNHLGFVLSERLINMPMQVVPHMYRMLADELRTAAEQGQPFTFTHFLFFSRTYRLSAEEQAALNAQSSPSQSKKRRASAQTSLPDTSRNGAYSFHHEDALIAQLASHTLDVPYSHSQPREEDAFGLDLGLRMMLVPVQKFPDIVSSLA
ncbi:p21-C-terminal region-binding protein-domain-containing protein, partial [Amylostereum chailletii]